MERQKAATRQVVEQMLEAGSHIDKAATVQECLKQDADMDVSLPRIQRVMTQDMHMSYAKIKQISLRGNSVNNLVMRQRFAVKMLALTQKKTVFLNIDESWLDASDFRRMKWRQKDSTNSMPIVQLSPRVAMIVGMDTLGNVYLSLTQVNTTAAIMELFFRKLVLKLNKERINWREDTIIIHDNAKYTATDSMMQLYEDLRIPYIFTGPHSYDFAPCELFFSWFKSASFNPDRLPLGKK